MTIKLHSVEEVPRFTPPSPQITNGGLCPTTCPMKTGKPGAAMAMVCYHPKCPWKVTS